MTADSFELIRLGQVQIIEGVSSPAIPENAIKSENKMTEVITVCKDKDEIQMLNLCDEVLGRTSSRQHKFDFLFAVRFSCTSNSKFKAIHCILYQAPLLF